MVKISYSYLKNVFEATSTSKYGKIFETEVTLKVFKQSITFEIDNIEITGAKLEQADGAYEEIGDDFILKDGAKLQLYYKGENFRAFDAFGVICLGNFFKLDLLKSINLNFGINNLKFIFN